MQFNEGNVFHNTMQIVKQQHQHTSKKENNALNQTKKIEEEKKNGYTEAKVTNDWIEWETSEVATLLLRYAIIIASLL